VGVCASLYTRAACPLATTTSAGGWLSRNSRRSPRRVAVGITARQNPVGRLCLLCPLNVVAQEPPTSNQRPQTVSPSASGNTESREPALASPSNSRLSSLKDGESHHSHHRRNSSLFSADGTQLPTLFCVPDHATSVPGRLLALGDIRRLMLAKLVASCCLAGALMFIDLH
jgi:hypothetical protein